MEMQYFNCLLQAFGAVKGVGYVDGKKPLSRYLFSKCFMGKEIYGKRKLYRKSVFLERTL